MIPFNEVPRVPKLEPAVDGISRLNVSYLDTRTLQDLFRIGDTVIVRRSERTGLYYVASGERAAAMLKEVPKPKRSKKPDADDPGH